MPHFARNGAPLRSESVLHFNRNTQPEQAEGANRDMVMTCIAFIHAITHGMDGMNYGHGLRDIQEEEY
jgi:hypothetical protein